MVETSLNVDNFELLHWADLTLAPYFFHYARC